MNLLLEIEKKLTQRQKNKTIAQSLRYSSIYSREPEDYTWVVYTAKSTIGLWKIIRDEWGLAEAGQSDSDDKKATELFVKIREYNNARGINYADWTLAAGHTIYIPKKHKWKDVTIQGASFPDDPIRRDRTIRLRTDLKDIYLPEMKKVLADQPIGMQLLCTIFAVKEGYYKGTKSYRTNNPGNIGNTDTGGTKTFDTLGEGIIAQKDYFLSVANGTHSAYPLGKRKVIAPYWSREIANHQDTYKMSPYVPGYSFVYTGELQQFVKIYSTGSRAKNTGLSMIISYFRQNGLNIDETSKIQDIIKMKKD